jgi:hypothetical protein
MSICVIFTPLIEILTNLFVTSETSFQLHCLPNVSESYVRKEKERIESSLAIVTQNLLHMTLESLNTSTDEFNIHGSVHRNNIRIYIQQDATLHSSFYLETAVHVSGGTVTHHQERIQLYLQHLVFVTPLLLFVANVGTVLSVL